LGAWDRNGRKHSADGADDHISAKGASKVFELRSEKPRPEVTTKKFNVFAQWGRIIGLNMNQNPVLPLVVLFVAVTVIAATVRLLTASRRGRFGYDRIEGLFTPAERSFLGVLEQIVGTRYRIFGKVRLADIIQTPKGLSNSARTSAFNRICARHVDFALCDPRTFEIIGVIELDDASHGRESRRKRDRFVDEALTAARVPFVRIAAQRGYAVAEIRERISGLFGKDVSRIA
jgi:hypothetical protein